VAAEAVVIPRRDADRRAWATPAWARLFAFVPLALFGALHWAALVDPGAGGALVASVAAASAAGALLVARGGASRRARIALGVAVALALAVVALLAAGVPLRLLRPRGWDDLAAGIGHGLGALPGVTVPYRRADAWTRTTILLGGTLLVALAALAAFWPGRRPGRQPVLAAVALSCLYGVAIVQRGPDQPFLDGAVFCLLLGAFLWLERLRAGQLGVAGACVLLATVAGALVGPRLDAGRPWIDYEQLGRHLHVPVGATFSWDHRYGPLNWPRRGREVLRVSARDSEYWKAETLDAFDGTRWLASGRVIPSLPDVEGPLKPAWRHRIHVVDRGLGGEQLIGAGTTLAVRYAPGSIESSPGVFQTFRTPLRPGASYDAVVYTPDPSARQLAGAGTRYPDLAIHRYLDVDIPAVPRAPGARPGFGRLTVEFPTFGERRTPIVSRDEVIPVPDPGLRTLRGSPYGRVYELARSLRAQARTPLDYVRLVMKRVQQGATYSEDVKVTRYPLVHFLFDDRRGYCQQFSGAMALLLRMGGVPARVAAGFSPGRYEASGRQYVVRDTDAHSWVEAYFPRIGWVTFDPTPGAAPASSQQDDPGGASPASGARPTPAGAALPREGATVGSGPDAAPSSTGGGPSAVLLAALAALAAALLTGGVVLGRRGRLPGPALAPELAELQRALHRSGRSPSPATTLARLERQVGGSEAGAGYLRALRDARFGQRGGGPTGAQRRALRDALGAGLGLRGRLRAWWALPPRLGRPGARRYPAS
jgi:transglutaminase-like putative cysteine protease